MFFRFLSINIFLVFVLNEYSHSQTIPSGFPVLEDVARRKSLLDMEFTDHSFALKPIKISLNQVLEPFNKRTKFDRDSVKVSLEKKSLDFKFLPVLSTTVFNSNRPFGWGNSSLLNGAGFQNLISAGFFLKLGFLEIQLRPEVVFSQNKPFQGYSGNFSENINFARFKSWNFGDHPEFFTSDFNRILSLGQSYISFNFGNLEFGAGSQNIWWGPGQFTSLIFSNNARGIPHLFLKTSSPLNIGLGHLEAQIIAGKAQDTGIYPSQNKSLNELFFSPFNGDWRYVNGINLIIQPKFLKGFFFGFNRTFQQYENGVEKSFSGRFPIFEAFQKKKFFEGGNTINYDALAQDQQVSVFMKFKSKEDKFELYAEFGKNDHNYNWREFILNPEHARAYLLGFSKLLSLRKPEEFIQIKAELIHQSESVNRYIRYPILGVLNTSWHTHYQVRGFTNFGESMGTGIGVGSNAQIIEFSKVKNVNKFGIQIQRVENNKDFYMRAADLNPKIRPWIDLTLGFLVDYKINDIILSSNLSFIKGINYQWNNVNSAVKDFPLGKDLKTFSGNIHIIYLLGKK